MGHIHVLPKTLVAKIAAGEVVERPASALKELIENALDAEATDISISIEQAGSKKIVVTDNGHGMEHDDVALSTKAHTTSKISTEKDLSNIRTLGFRGEALASIAAVSRLAITSKTESEAIGTKVIIGNGTIGKPQKAGAPTGTTVVVETLFSQTPARKKFLKTPATEFRHIMRVVTHAALACTDVRFTLSHNGKTVLELPEGQSMEERVHTLLGDSTFSQLILLSRTSPHLGIAGFLGRPQIAAREKDKQYLFINGRSVSSSLISNVIKNAYGSLLEPKEHPLFVLYLTLPAHSIDVNIHPRKETVHFVNERTISEIITRSVEQALGKNDLTYSIDNDTSLILRDKGMAGYTASVLKDMVDPWQVGHGNTFREPEILQVQKCFLITETKKGLLIVDQHAAHERILYEQFKKAFKEAQTNQETHTLPEALVFDLPPVEGMSLTTHVSTFKQLGFEIEPFGDTAFKVRSVPLLFKDRDSATLISEVLEDLVHGETQTKLDTETERTISYLACRGAIKAGDYLTHDERKNLLEKLAQTTTQYTCPHGRPTHIEISRSELDRMFKRK